MILGVVAPLVGNETLVGVGVEVDQGDIEEQGDISSSRGGGSDGVIVVMEVVASDDERPGDGDKGAKATVALTGDWIALLLECWLMCLLKLRKLLDIGVLGHNGLLTGLETELPVALKTELLRVEPPLLVLWSSPGFPRTMAPNLTTRGPLGLICISGGAYSATSFLSTLFPR